MTEFHVTRFLSDGTKHTHRTYRRGYSAALRFQQLAYEMLGDSADRDTNEGHRVMDAAERMAEAVTRGGFKTGTVESRGRRIVIEVINPAPSTPVEPAASVVGAPARPVSSADCEIVPTMEGYLVLVHGRPLLDEAGKVARFEMHEAAKAWIAGYDAPAPAMVPQPCQQQQAGPRVTVTVRNDNPATIWNRLAARLGREPTPAEAKAAVLRILRGEAL